MTRTVVYHYYCDQNDHIILFRREQERQLEEWLKLAPNWIRKSLPNTDGVITTTTTQAKPRNPEVEKQLKELQEETRCQFHQHFTRSIFCTKVTQTDFLYLNLKACTILAQEYWCKGYS
jgi:hypothetical protein